MSPYTRKFRDAFIDRPSYWSITVVLWALVVGASYAAGMSLVRDHAMAMAEMRGQLVFSMIQTMRLWNANHGGVYGPVTDESPANPYLETREKVISTPSGILLTKINPAYMTRQLGDLMKRGQVKIHLTSLRPINPGNQPDSWERAVLEGFEAGRGETSAVVRDDGEDLFRYMAPMTVEAACLQCHAKQGYREGDVRGGLSVSFPAAFVTEFVAQHRPGMVTSHVLAFVLLSALTLYSLRSIRRRVRELEDERDGREVIIADRTQELENEILVRRRSEEALAEREAMIRSVLDTAGEGIYQIDTEGRCVMCNPATVRILGYDSADELIGRDIHEMIHHTDAEGRHLALGECQLHSVVITGQPAHLTHESFWRKDGSRIPVECYSYPVVQNDRVTAAVISFFDMSRHRETEDELRRLATLDSLTQAYNRRYFQERAGQELARSIRYRTPLSVLMMDLDHFKSVNDTHGHATGDRVLKMFAALMRKQMRETDIFGRLGGEEFALVLSNTSADRAAVHAERLRAATAELRIPGNGGTFSVTLSIGIASLREDHPESLQDLVDRADAALYRAKRAGRNRVESGNPV